MAFSLMRSPIGNANAQREPLEKHKKALLADWQYDRMILKAPPNKGICQIVLDLIRSRHHFGTSEYTRREQSGNPRFFNFFYMI